MMNMERVVIVHYVEVEADRDKMMQENVMNNVVCVAARYTGRLLRVANGYGDGEAATD
jgi:signal transduction histidine kinase